MDTLQAQPGRLMVVSMGARVAELAVRAGTEAGKERERVQ